MKITIDTREDSHHEIRKVISLLQNLLGETPSESPTQSIFDNPAPETQPEPSGFMNMFGSNSSTPETTEKKDPETYGEEDKESDTVDIPEIIPY